MIHVGVDLHQRFCYMTVLEARGKIVQAGSVTNEKLALRKHFRQFQGKEVQVAAGTELAALDHGGSGPGDDALFSGGQALRPTAAA